MAHFVLSDFLALSLDQMPAAKTAYPAGIAPAAPSASTAAMELGRHASHQFVRSSILDLTFTFPANSSSALSNALGNRFIYCPGT